MTELEKNCKHYEEILDELSNHSDWEVRCVVAEHGYGLDHFIEDPNPNVREEVARQGYKLDQLIEDPDERVRENAENKIKEKENKND